MQKRDTLADQHAAWLEEQKTKPENLNPMVPRHGRGPEGMTCGGCLRLIARKYSSTYFKCSLYGDTRSTATDFRKSWPACGQYYEAVAK